MPDEAGGVADQVVQHLAQQHRVGADHRQVTDVDAGPFAGHDQRGRDVQGEVLGVHRLEVDGGVGGGRVRDQLVHGAEHAPGAARDPVQETARRRVQLGCGVLQQQGGEAGDGVQRDEQVLAGGGRETGQLGTSARATPPRPGRPGRSRRGGGPPRAGPDGRPGPGCRRRSARSPRAAGWPWRRRPARRQCRRMRRRARGPGRRPRGPRRAGPVRRSLVWYPRDLYRARTAGLKRRAAGCRIAPVARPASCITDMLGK